MNKLIHGKYINLPGLASRVPELELSVEKLTAENAKAKELEEKILGTLLIDYNDSSLILLCSCEFVMFHIL